MLSSKLHRIALAVVALSVARSAMAATISVSQDRRSTNFVCHNDDVSVSGNANNLSFSGHCNRVTVSGNRNNVALDDAVLIITSGNRNFVSWHRRPADVDDTGEDNALSGPSAAARSR